MNYSQNKPPKIWWKFANQLQNYVPTNISPEKLLLQQICVLFFPQTSLLSKILSESMNTICLNHKKKLIIGALLCSMGKSGGISNIFLQIILFSVMLPGLHSSPTFNILNTFFLAFCVYWLQSYFEKSL